MLSYAYARSGQQNRAQEIRQQLEARRPRAGASALARLYVGLGNTEAAFRALEQAFEDRADIISL